LLPPRRGRLRLRLRGGGAAALRRGAGPPLLGGRRAPAPGAVVLRARPRAHADRGGGGAAAGALLVGPSRRPQPSTPLLAAAARAARARAGGGAGGRALGAPPGQRAPAAGERHAGGGLLERRHRLFAGQRPRLPPVLGAAP